MLCEVNQYVFRSYVSTVLLHAVCMLCSESASSLIAACFVFSVSGFTACL